MAQTDLGAVANGLFSLTTAARSTADPLIVRKTAGTDTEVVALYVNPSALAGATIDKVEAVFTIAAVPNAGGTLELCENNFAIGTADAVLFAALLAEAAYDTLAPTVGDKVVELPGAETLLQVAIDTAAGWFSVGWRYAVGAGTRRSDIAAGAVLRVTYSGLGNGARRTLLGVGR